ncbi:hypothetical protein M9H61_17590 [Thalassospira sp. GO-4]|uniref:acylneuraminate cytidylyltransferase family protein n=1 Tax=Thalassospira sp. GO-4 TaxID=2946605 RepID=UPI002024579B|nr:hypothetical protein [Thalassospira sp. GO-4]URK17346.1 hypothetical protein M9H61_17590 [Thalassospira sp. GO-4]
MRLVAGKPLLHYSIAAAKLAPQIHRVVVSSEDNEPLEYAEAAGVNIHRRETSLSDEITTNFEVLRSWYNSEKIKPDLVVLLQPSHPFRNIHELSSAVEIMKASPTLDSFITIKKAPKMIGTISAQNDFSIACETTSPEVLYQNAGTFYIFRPERTFNMGSKFGDKIGCIKLTFPQWEVDVDYEQDLLYAEAIIDCTPELQETYLKTKSGQTMT